MNHKLFLLLFLSAFTKLQAQQVLEKKVPTQATFVLSFNLTSLSQKVNFDDLGNYNFLKKSETEPLIQSNSILKELFRLPEKAGISRNGKLFIFPENHDSIKNLNYLIAIADAKAFETRITDILKTKQSEPKFNKDGKIKVLTYEHKMSFSLAKDYVIISIWDAPYYSYYDYDEYNMERSRVIQIIDSTKYANMPMDTTPVEYDEIPSDSLAIEEFVPLPDVDEPDAPVEDNLGYTVDSAAAAADL